MTNFYIKPMGVLDVQTKIKRWTKVSLALLGGLVALTLLWPINGLAASPLTGAFTAVDGNSTTYSSGENYVSGTGDFSGGDPDSIQAFQVNSVEANYANNGVLTNRTTQLRVHFSNNPPVSFSENPIISSFKLNVFNGNNVNTSQLAPSLLSPGSPAMPDLGGPFTTNVYLDHSTVTLDVELANLKDDFQVYIWFDLIVTATAYSGSASY